MKEKTTPTYRIACRVELPLHLQGTYFYWDAYILACEWNRQHYASEAAWPERVEKGKEWVK